MFKIWVKVLDKNKKLLINDVFEFEEKFDISRFYAYTQAICNRLDLATPVVLQMHAESFEKFNIVRFRASDFVEKIRFDTLQFEAVHE